MARSVIGDLLGDFFGGAEARLRRVDRVVVNATDSIQERVWRAQQRVLAATATILRILALLEAVRVGNGVGLLFISAFLPLSVFRAVARQRRREGSRFAWAFQGLCIAGTIGVLITAYVFAGSIAVVVLAGAGELAAWMARRADERADDIETEKVRRAFRETMLER
ncbi:MAG: hypothetical protein R2726_20660 [Acidimicrobiales bacterium]